MIKRITIQEIPLVLDGYGKITVPVGTTIIRKKEDNTIIFHPENEENILIPDEYLKDHIRESIQVKFSHSDIGYCRDCFKVKKKNVFVCRQEETNSCHAWYMIPDIDFEEPGSYLKSNLIIEVLNSKGEVITSECNQRNGYLVKAEKKFPFSWENNSNQLQGEELELFKRVYN